MLLSKVYLVTRRIVQKPPAESWDLQVLVLGCAVLLFLVASWLLRRQAAVASTI
jgi:hypothetical protein